MRVGKRPTELGGKMRVDFTQKGDFKNAMKWLDSGRTLNGVESILRKYGSSGVAALRNATPRDSGETAYGWDYRIKKSQNGVELIFVNNAHPELSVNLAMLIQLGHATKNGGYVQPVNYIRPALMPILKAAGEELARRYFK